MKNPSSKWINAAMRCLCDVLEEVSKTQKLPQGIKRNFSVELSFVSKKKMIELNKKYRKKYAPTDILSFQATEFYKKTGFLGELIICYPVLRKQAKERNLTDEMELLILLVHGVLHLYGWDHEKSRVEAQKMAQLETKILKKCVPKTWIQKSKGNCLQGLIERVE